MSTIESNLQVVRARIATAARAAGRKPGDIALLAVSKAFAAGEVRAAYAAGQREFGENYVQEAVEKIAALPALPLIWHFIGPIQSNKTRAIAEHFDWVHSVAREKIALRLAQARPPKLGPLDICLQVNLSGETSRSGVAADAVSPLAEAVRSLPRLRLRGLMAIPEPSGDIESQRRRFRGLRLLLEQLNAAGFGLDTLSMGMSQDLEAAVMEGATIVRVGTAIFGERAKA
ncbi:MAG: YggS family pyridoxal phosphate-dependent enzyme [Betaproteobacteria bacterium]|nr:MAG: YggS family pyridoxal phosphate-dependent enzyme [Betaproteobacteria bacterium]